MPAISEDAVSSSEERDSDTPSSGKRTKIRSTPNGVVGEKREHFLPSAGGRRMESTGYYDDQVDGNSSWMVLSTRGNSESSPLVPAPVSQLEHALYGYTRVHFHRQR